MPGYGCNNYNNDTVSVFLNQGDGTFQEKVDHNTGSWPISVALGDLNRNGRPDMAIANIGSDTVSVVLNLSQVDKDADQIGDACDNCPDHPNPEQENADADGIGDICDSYLDHSYFCLRSGLNIFGYPVEIPSGYTSYNLIKYLGMEDEIEKIQRYNPNIKDYETTFYLGGNADGDNFNIMGKEGYLIYMKKDKMVPFSGSIISQNISLVKGLNIISMPRVPPGYTSYDLLSYIGSPDEIVNIKRFNKKKGIFEITTYYYGKPSGIEFKIVNGAAYLINMKISKNMDCPG